MIAACHVTATSAETTDTASIVALYDALLAQVPSPTVALNRAIAVAAHAGPGAGLALLEPLHSDSRLRAGHLLHAARAELLRRQHDHAAAARAYRSALDRVTNDAERAHLQRKLDQLR